VPPYWGLSGAGVTVGNWGVSDVGVAGVTGVVGIAGVVVCVGVVGVAGVQAGMNSDSAIKRLAAAPQYLLFILSSFLVVRILRRV